jgi:hypothetical protein
MYDSAMNYRATSRVLDGAALDTAIDEARAELAALLRAPGGGPGRPQRGHRGDRRSAVLAPGR